MCCLTMLVEFSAGMYEKKSELTVIHLLVFEDTHRFMYNLHSHKRSQVTKGKRITKWYVPQENHLTNENDCIVHHVVNNKHKIVVLYLDHFS
jgi:hypothetical protein